MESIQPDVILSTARYWGRFAGYVLAEPLRIVRQRDSETALDARRAEQEQSQAQPLSARPRAETDGEKTCAS